MSYYCIVMIFSIFSYDHSDHCVDLHLLFSLLTIYIDDFEITATRVVIEQHYHC